MQRNVLPTVLRADVVMSCLVCQKEAACDYGLRCCFLFALLKTISSNNRIGMNGGAVVKKLLE